MKRSKTKINYLFDLAGAQVLCLENKMLQGLFQETKTTIMTEMRKLKNFIYSATDTC